MNMKGKEYEFTVTFGVTYGTFYEEAENFEEAYDKAIGTILDALKELPVQVDFNIDCVDGYDEDDEEEDLEYGRCSTCRHYGNGNVCSDCIEGCEYEYRKV